MGVIGCGNISAAYFRLAPLFRGIAMKACADINMDAAKARAKEFDLRAETVEELLRDEEIDIVVNLTIPAVHYAVSKEILDAGKHVYSEKPFVLSVEDGRDLRQRAEKADLRIGSAPDTFLGGAHQLARALIDDGRLGRITSGTAFVMSHGMEHWHPNPDFFFQVGGGPILDLGPYYITDLIHLLGPVRRLSAFTNMARAERVVTAPGPYQGTTIKVGTPTTIHGVLEFHSGAIITIGASWDVASHGHHNIELYGTDGTIYVPDPNFFGGDLVTADIEGTKTPVTPWEHPFGKANQGLDTDQPRANYRAAGLSDMMLSVENGTTARCGIDVALHTVDVMTSLLKAGESGQVLTLSTTCERPRALGPEEARALLRA